MNIAVCIGCLVAVTLVAGVNGVPELQVALEAKDEGYNISRNEHDTDEENSMKARKGSGYCMPSPYCSEHGYCIKERQDCNGTVLPQECCGSFDCFCCIPECYAPFRKIPGSGRCYLFSAEAGASKRSWTAARQYCEEKGGDLATTGFLPATDEDPLMAFVQEKALGPSLAGAYWTGSEWMWVDGRKLSLKSNMWLPTQPSGGEHCVEILEESGRPYNTATLNDITCSHPRAFICEYKHKAL